MKVSIIVAVYNIENFIKGCILSLVNQSYTDMEIILVDDGSTDSSGLICNQFAMRDKRISVIHKINGGLSSARNAGLDVASGDFVMFIDGDDYLTENAVEILVNIQNKYKSDIVQFDYEETNELYFSKANTEKVEAVYIANTRMMFDKLYELGGCAASACTKLYKRELFGDLRFKEHILHEDEQMITYMLQEAKSITYIKNKLYCYYMRDGSIIKSSFNIRKLDIFDILKERCDVLSSLGYIDLIEKEHTRYFMTLIYHWAEAKRCGADEACTRLTELMQKFIKTNRVKVNGYNKLIYTLCKINPKFICIYYYIHRLIKGKKNEFIK